MAPALELLAERFGTLPQVLAVALGGSRSSGTPGAQSDFDLYVYAVDRVPFEFRRSLAPPEAEIDNRFFEPGDEWIDAATGSRIDIMYRSPEWIEDQLAGVLDRHQASIGYSTCIWYNVLHSRALFDPRSWFAGLQERANVPYPEPLRDAIIARNLPLLRRNQSSFLHQIRLAIVRNDAVSRQHRLTALLASFFDVWFALERAPHPGEKRLLSHLPPEWSERVQAVLETDDDALVKAIDALLDALESRIEPSPPPGAVHHVGTWAADLERAREFYERWFGAIPGPRYESARRPFQSYFLKLGTGASLEIMAAPGRHSAIAHVAISVGSPAAVDTIIGEMRNAGVRIVEAPRTTGDGHYEAVIEDSEGNVVEISAGR